MNIWKQPTINESKIKTIVERLADESAIINESPAMDEIEVESAPTELGNQWDDSTDNQVSFEIENYKTEDLVNVAGEPDEEKKMEPFPELEVVGQIHGTYIVAQMEDGFYLIDQHVRQERIKYEYFKEKVGKWIE